MRFDMLITAAKSKLRLREKSGAISCGQVSAAIETDTGNIYTGVCIDTPCSLGICAERNAIGTMVTEGEFHIKKLVCIKDNQLLLPCGACRELLMQVHPENQGMQILTNLEGHSVKLIDLLPNCQ